MAIDPNWRHAVYLRVDDAAAIAGISAASIYRFHEQGKIKFVKMAGRTLIDCKIFQDFIANPEEYSASGTRGAAARAARKVAARKALGVKP